MIPKDDIQLDDEPTVFQLHYILQEWHKEKIGQGLPFPASLLVASHFANGHLVVTRRVEGGQFVTDVYNTKVNNE